MVGARERGGVAVSSRYNVTSTATVIMVDMMQLTAVKIGCGRNGLKHRQETIRRRRVWRAHERA